jgi:hypothetical protein
MMRHRRAPGSGVSDMPAWAKVTDKLTSEVDEEFFAQPGSEMKTDGGGYTFRC